MNENRHCVNSGLEKFSLKTINDIENLLIFNQIKKVSNKFICPFCHSGTKSNKTSGFSIFQDSKTGKGRYYCFSCTHSGDFFDLYQHFTGQRYEPQSYETQSPPKQHETQSTKQPFRLPETLSCKDILFCKSCLLVEPSFDAMQALDYLAQRGIYRHHIAAFDIGLHYLKDKKTPFIVLPCYDISGNLKGFRKRFFTRTAIEQHGKEKAAYQSGFLIWNEKAFQNQKPILIFEGIIDALTAYSLPQIASKFDAIAINGVGNAKKFIEWIKQSGVKNQLFAFMDNDNAGDIATATLCNAGLNIQDIRQIIAPYKDINDFFKNTVINQLNQLKAA